MKAPIIQEWQERLCEHGTKKGLITKPSGRAAVMWGGWGELIKAVERGDVVKLQCGEGKDFYQWKEFDEWETNSVRGGVGTSGWAKASSQNYHAINERLRKVNLALDLTPAEMKAWAQQPTQVPAKVFENLIKVQMACDKGMADAKGLYRRLMDLAVSDGTAKSLLDAVKAAVELSLIHI